MTELLHWQPARPLRRQRILLTRAEDGLSQLTDALTQAGAQVKSLPLTTIRPLETPLLLKSAPDWLFFTSRQGIVHSLPLLKKAGWLSTVPVAVVGASTARFAQEVGLQVAFCPQPPYCGASAAAQFASAMTGERLSILWPCSALAGNELGNGLAAHQLYQWPVYVSVPRAELLDEEQASLSQGQPFDWVMLTSPTAAIVWSRLCPVGLKQVPLVSMGPKTTAAIAKHWPKATVREATTASPAGVIEVMR